MHAGTQQCGRDRERASFVALPSKTSGMSDRFPIGLTSVVSPANHMVDLYGHGRGRFFRASPNWRIPGYRNHFLHHHG